MGHTLEYRLIIAADITGVNVLIIRKLFMSSAVIGILLSFGLSASPALAESSDEGSLRLSIMVNGQLVELDKSFIADHTLDLHSSEEPASGPISPSLINFDQWFGCFSLNNENDIFAEYTHYWDGVPHDIKLKCGNGSWGYKHIRADKETLWQKELDAARAAGWNSQSQGIDSWDDLMASTAGVAITWPEYVGNNAISNTKCGVAQAYFVNEVTGAIEYVFGATAAWATDSDRLITAFPSTRQNC